MPKAGRLRKADAIMEPANIPISNFQFPTTPTPPYPRRGF